MQHTLKSVCWDSVLSKPTEPTEPSKPVDTNPIENPVNTDTGVVIVAVEDSKPIIQLADGTTKKLKLKKLAQMFKKTEQ